MIWDFRPGPIKNKPQQKAAPHINQPTDFPCDSVSHGNSGNKYKNSLKKQSVNEFIKRKIAYNFIKNKSSQHKKQGPILIDIISW